MSDTSVHFYADDDSAFTVLLKIVVLDDDKTKLMLFENSKMVPQTIVFTFEGNIIEVYIKVTNTLVSLLDDCLTFMPL